MANTYDDVMLIEDGLYEEGDFDYYAAMQRQINSGTIWQLQGSMGRAAMDAIDAGKCMCGKESRRDYYGNVIPSRTMVEDGTKGSKGYVAEKSGADWAEKMEAVE